jgi:hypothetical protein
VAASFKTFVQILMAVLSLGVSVPMPVCAADVSEHGQSCCEGKAPACAGHCGQPCQESCLSKIVQPLDKQVSVRTAALVVVSNGVCLFSAVPVVVKKVVCCSPALRWGVNASQFLASSPPQAALCLWRI